MIKLHDDGSIPGNCSVTAKIVTGPTHSFIMPPFDGMEPNIELLTKSPKKYPCETAHTVHLVVRNAYAMLEILLAYGKANVHKANNRTRGFVI